jgi:lysophospholipase L1-like esterase
MRWLTLLALIAVGLITACDTRTTPPPPAPVPPSVTPPPPVATATPDFFPGRTQMRADGVLAAFFRRLAALEATKKGRVDILQLGDSHTAGGALSGRLRDDLQGRFGGLGAGFMVPGEPFPGSQRPDVTVTTSGKWQYYDSLMGSPQSWGLSGFVARSRTAGASMSLSTKDPDGFDLVTLHVVHQVGGGDLVVSIDNAIVQSIQTRGVAGQLEVVMIRKSGHVLRVSAHDAKPVDLIGWSVERNRGGIVFDSAGVVGARITVINRWDPAIVAEELRDRDPALVILAFGTNEGFDRDLDMVAYGEAFTAITRSIRQTLPNAALLIVGSPDGQMLPKACHPQAAVKQCAESPPPPGKCGWYTPPNLAPLRDLQRKIAEHEGIAFWDWSQVMEPVCGIDRWVRATPPLARDDHIHLTRAGYERSADSLFAWMMDQYQLFNQAKIAALH